MGLGARLEEGENPTLIRFLKAHSGRPARDGAQCQSHASMQEMTWRQAEEAQMAHHVVNPATGKPYTRQWLQPLCKLLEIETRGKKGPVKSRTREFILQQARERWQRYYGIKREDPEWIEKERQRQRNKSKKRRKGDDPGLAPA